MKLLLKNKNKTILRIMLLSIISLSSIIVQAQNVFTVTKTTDPDPFIYPFNNDDALCDPVMFGTLQWALKKVNNAATPSIINFNIPGSGSHIIALIGQPVVVGNQVTIDGYSQPQGEVIIQLPLGNGNLGNFVFWFSQASSNNTIIQGLHFSGYTDDGFDTYGIITSYNNNIIIRDNVFTNIKKDIFLGNSHTSQIYRNLFGVDKNGTNYPEFTGSVEAISVGYAGAGASNNVVGGIGDKQNTITNKGAGVRIVEGNHNLITRNKIYNNSQGAIRGITSTNQNDFKTKPTINTIVNLSNVTGTSNPGDIVELFGSTGSENANEYLTSVVADVNGNWSADLTAATTRTYISATATDVNNNTSELAISAEFVNNTCASCTKLKFCHPYLACTGKEVSFINQSINCIENPAFVWNFGDGSGASLSPVHIYSADGTYTVTLSYPSSGSCQAKSISSVINLFNDCMNPCVIPPVISVYASNSSICSGDSTVLAASGGVTYAWAPATGLSSTIGATVTASPIATTTYTVEGTNSNGCKNSSTITIIANPKPLITISGPSSICIGGTAILSANGATSYSWTPSTGLNTSSGSTVQATPAQTMVYTIIGTNENGCEDTNTISVTVNPVPTITVSDPSPICNGGSTILSSTGATTYSWSPATGLSATVGDLVKANPISTTTYTVTGTNSYNCTNTNSITVTLNPNCTNLCVESD